MSDLFWVRRVNGDWNADCNLGQYIVSGSTAYINKTLIKHCANRHDAKQACQNYLPPSRGSRNDS